MGDLLIVDDELLLTEAYARFFARRGHDVRQATTGAAAIAALGARRPDVMLLDVNLPDRSGFEVFATLPEDGPVVVMISGQAEVPLAVRAMKQGVENFLTKPVDLEHLGVAIDRAFETARLRQLRRYLNDRRTSTGQVALGSSPLMREMTTQVDLLAGTAGTAVLLLGESGTGKGRIAELIHAGSVRATGPFVECSCSGAAVDALDAELFGFDDVAGLSRPGLVELAAGGSLFLDEVADLPLFLQPKVLRVLEGRAVRRAGGTREMVPDVRLLTATSQDLVTAVSQGRFREDLYYRLSVMPLRLPPLRARSREDLVELIGRLMDELAPQLPTAPRRIDDAALDRLLRHTWPGNIRELRNVLERAMIVGRGHDTLRAGALPAEVRSRGGLDGGTFEARPLDDIAREHIERSLLEFRGNRSHTAKALGISRATLIKKIREYGFETPVAGHA